MSFGRFLVALLVISLCSSTRAKSLPEANETASNSTKELVQAVIEIPKNLTSAQPPASSAFLLEPEKNGSYHAAVVPVNTTKTEEQNKTLTQAIAPVVASLAPGTAPLQMVDANLTLKCKGEDYVIDGTVPACHNDTLACANLCRQCNLTRGGGVLTKDICKKRHDAQVPVVKWALGVAGLSIGVGSFIILGTSTFMIISCCNARRHQASDEDVERNPSGSTSPPTESDEVEKDKMGKQKKVNVSMDSDEWTDSFKKRVNTPLAHSSKREMLKPRNGHNNTPEDPQGSHD